MLIILELLLVIPGILSYEQHDYSIAFERVQVSKYNKEYMRSVKVVTYKYNRTQAAVNGTCDLLKDLGNDVEVIAQAYTFLSNEYRTFPIHLGLNFCNVVNANDFGLGSIVQDGYFSGCPLKKGIVSIYNWKPDQSRFPPYIPNGQYKLEVQFFYFSTEVLVLEGYGTISRPLGRRH